MVHGYETRDFDKRHGGGRSHTLRSPFASLEDYNWLEKSSMKAHNDDSHDGGKEARPVAFSRGMAQLNERNEYRIMIISSSFAALQVFSDADPQVLAEVLPQNSGGPPQRCLVSSRQGSSFWYGPWAD